MNFLSKLIIVIIILLMASVTLMGIEFYNLKDNQAKLNSEIETINDRLNFVPNKKTEPITTNETFGIDVSHWNGDIVTEIPSNDDISFVICKATQGKKIIDADFKSNWTSIKQLNKIRGAYHFYIYGDDPEEQANHFCSVVNDLEETDISLILDIEELSLPKKGVDHVKLKEDVLKFLEIVEDKIKRTPIIYTNYSFANEYLNESTFSKFPLWLAEYSNLKKPKIPNTWKDKGCFIWQKKGNYNINSTKEDYDIFFGKKEDLIK